MKIHPLPKYEDVVSQSQQADGTTNSVVLKTKSHKGLYFGLAFGLFIAGVFMWGNSYSWRHGGIGLGGSYQGTLNSPSGKAHGYIIEEGKSSITLGPPTSSSNQQTASQPGIVVIQGTQSSSNTTSNSTGK